MRTGTPQKSVCVCECLPLLYVLHHFRLSTPQETEGIFINISPALWSYVHTQQ